MTETYADKVIELLAAIPDLSELSICPSVFSDDTINHDCDECRASKRNRGDLYDEDVCYKCWREAIQEAYVVDANENVMKGRRGF